jgi:hypothetical protein
LLSRVCRCSALKASGKAGLGTLAGATRLEGVMGNRETSGAGLGRSGIRGGVIAPEKFPVTSARTGRVRGGGSSGGKGKTVPPALAAREAWGMAWTDGLGGKGGGAGAGPDARVGRAGTSGTATHEAWLGGWVGRGGGVGSAGLSKEWDVGGGGAPLGKDAERTSPQDELEEAREVGRLPTGMRMGGEEGGCSWTGPEVTAGSRLPRRRSSMPAFRIEARRASRIT